MNRRSILAMIGCGGITLSGGCLSDVAFGSDPSCPSIDAENNVSYDVQETRGVLEEWEQGIELATNSSEVKRFDYDRWFDEEDWEWISEIDFDNELIIGVQATSGGDSSNSPFEIISVGKESGNEIHVYSCLATVGEGDVAYQYARLLRVSHNGQIPTAGKYIHIEEGRERSYETTV